MPVLIDGRPVMTTHNRFNEGGGIPLMVLSEPGVVALKDGTGILGTELTEDDIVSALP